MKRIVLFPLLFTNFELLLPLSDSSLPKVKSYFWLSESLPTFAFCHHSSGQEYLRVERPDARRSAYVIRACGWTRVVFPAIYEFSGSL